MNKKGFTLMELLIVVAIIAVLVIVSIPVFASQVERSSESADISNIKSAKSSASAQYLSGEDLDGKIISDEGFSCYFDASSGKLTKDIPSGYGRGSESDGGCEDCELVVKPTTSITQEYYTSKSNVKDKYLIVFINAKGTIKLSWSDNKTSDNNTNSSKGDDTNIEETTESTSGYNPPDGYSAYIMSYSNRDMVDFSFDSYNSDSEFEYEGVKYYFKGFEKDCLLQYDGTITIPKSVDYISNDAFFEVRRINNFNVIDNNNYKAINDDKILMTYDGKKIIRAAYDISNFNFPSSVKEIGYGAFAGCSKNLKSITVPNTVTDIDACAFYSCRYLQTFNISGSVKTIKLYTIYNPANSVNITLDEGVETLESGAIYAKSITINLPSTIKSIKSDSIKLTNPNNSFTCKYKGVTYTKISDVVDAINN